MLEESNYNLAKIREALKSAEEELASLDERRHVLIKFLAVGYQLLGEHPAVQAKRRGRPATGIHTHIAAMMRECGGPLSVAEMTDTLVNAGLIHGRWAREVIRNALNRGAQFQRIKPGVYQLRTDTPDAT